MSTVVLVVEDDQAMQRSLVAMLNKYGNLQVETADDGVDGLARARAVKPDLIVSDYDMPGLNGFELCTRVKSDPEIRDAMFIVLTGFTDTRLKISGLNLGVDDYLTKPVEVAEFLAKIRAVLRIKELHDRLREDKTELEVLHERLSTSFDRLLNTMIQMLGLKVTGAAERGEHLARHAVTLARHMDVPDRFLDEIVLAARLQEIGRLTTDIAPEPMNPWPYIPASCAILESIEQLSGVASLVSSIGEHWDGSGRPDHLIRGQIPLRSRILRSLIDLFASCADHHTTTAEALAELERYTGTRYDPLVVSHLTDLFRVEAAAEWLPDRRQIPVTELAAGMQLAEDLTTSSGVRLLGRGAVVSAGTLNIIMQRHANDPILYGAWIQHTG